jgi:predicted ArsR family transcriptional regulator
MEQLDALGDPAVRSTLLFVRASRTSVTAAEVASALALPRTVARWRLERLVDKGLLESAFERRSGRSGPGAGRPAKTYAPRPETVAIEFPRRRYEALIEVLVAALPRRRRAATLAEIGREYGTELARAAKMRRATTMPRGLDALCRGLGRIGFQARVESITDEQAVIVSATCPMRPLVVGDPTLRPLDTGMWHGLIAAAAGDAAAREVVCRTHDCLDAGAACRIVVTLRGRKPLSRGTRTT